MTVFKKGDRVKVVDRASVFEGRLGVVRYADPKLVRVDMEVGGTVSRGTLTAHLDLEIVVPAAPLHTNHGCDSEPVLTAAQWEAIRRGEVRKGDRIGSMGGRHLHFESGKQSDPVNHPAHYGGDAPYEALKVIEAWGLGFNLGNTTMYVSRAGKKGPALQDLRKAAFYLDREIQHLEAQGRAK